ncbi:MAG: sodium:calcium antiporter [Actinomycetota bacterium]
MLAAAAVLVGIVLLAYASDQFVIGAARVARLRNLPPVVVGVVIIGFGTSSPELLVSVLAAIEGEPGVAIGNVVGSNLANLTLLIGVGAAMVTLEVNRDTVRREAVLAIIATAAFGLAVQGGGLTRLEGAALSVAMVAVLAYVVYAAASDDMEHEPDPESGIGREALRLLLGLAGTIAGAQLLLSGALELADRAGLSAGFVGATLVAMGTSLPELVTVIQSARRKATGLIVGNLLGSNLFNSLGVAGAIGLAGGTGIDDAPITGLAVIASIVAAVAAGIAMWTDYRVTRREGVVLVLAYVILVPILA